MSWKKNLFLHSCSPFGYSGVLLSLQKKRLINRRRRSRYFYRNLKRHRRFFIRSNDEIKWKNIKLLFRFMGLRGQIIPRRVSKVKMKQQRLLTTEIKKSPILGLLTFTENEKHWDKVQRLKQGFILFSED